jgi:glycine/serine hydroxymethyltransferase
MAHQYGTFIAQCFYGVDKETGRLDYDKIQEIQKSNQN